MGLGFMFLAALAAFVLIILFLTWYYRAMSNLIFGKMNGMMDTIINDGVPPVQWHRRMNKLNKVMNDVNANAEQKNKALDKHIRFVELSIKDMCAYAQKTVFLADDYARQEAVYALEKFRDETIYILKDMKI